MNGPAKEWMVYLVWLAVIANLALTIKMKMVRWTR